MRRARYLCERALAQSAAQLVAAHALGTDGHYARSHRQLLCPPTSAVPAAHAAARAPARACARVRAAASASHAQQLEWAQLSHANCQDMPQCWPVLLTRLPEVDTVCFRRRCCTTTVLLVGCSLVSMAGGLPQTVFC